MTLLVSFPESICMTLEISKCLDVVKLQVLCLGLGVDFTFTWDNNHNQNNNNNHHLNFLKGTVVGDMEQKKG